jgi:hypothetical protein
MDKKKSIAEKQRKKQRNWHTTMLFIAACIIGYWLAYQIFTASDCEFFGSKLAYVIVPICTAMGNVVAAIIPFAFGSLSAWLAWQSIMNSRHLTLRSSGTAQKRAAP